MSDGFRSGNCVELLENGEQFFPRCFQAIAAARHEVFLETFILADDHLGRQLQQALARAARRGVRVELTIDAWGSMDIGEDFVRVMTKEGVRVHRFEHRTPRWRLRLAWFGRLHRKLVVVDRELAFIGGINFSADHLNSGPRTNHDFAILIRGPIVRDMHALVTDAIASARATDGSRPDSRIVGHASGDQMCGTVEVALVVRDNADGRRTAIEDSYRSAVRGALRRVIIANAYFFPSCELVQDICDAARRGVDVRLLLQKRPDLRIAKLGATLLYDQLIASGVRVLEYEDRLYHGKVAVVDEDWVTLGSSNLDPMSLCFNLEANVVVRDRAFNRLVASRLESLMGGCREVERAGGWRPLRRIAQFIASRLIRQFSRLAHVLPARRPVLTVADHHAAAERAPGSRPGHARSERSRRLRQALGMAFIVAIAVVLVVAARRIDWAGVATAIRGYSAGTLGIAFALSVLGHLIYTTYDLLGQMHTRHTVPRHRVVAIAFVSYTFTLNLGAVFGAIGTRFRLYSAQGLGDGTIGRIAGFSIVTNWLGYLAIGGVVFTWRVVELPASWRIGAEVFQWLGIAMIGLVAVYMGACARARRRGRKLGSVAVELPPVGMALVQLAVSLASWLTIAGIMFVLLRHQLSFAVVLGVVLIAAVAALIAHVPAGLGVLEGTLVMILGPVVPVTELVAAALAYRAVYYLAPLVPAAVVFAALARSRDSGSSTA